MNSQSMTFVFCLAVTAFLTCVGANPAHPPCEPGHFHCHRDNRCIPNEWKCDGDPDCENGEDETRQVCQNRSCDEGYFQCASGRCVPENWRCDKDRDCIDGSDERNCTYDPADGSGSTQRRRRSSIQSLVDKKKK